MDDSGSGDSCGGCDEYRVALRLFGEDTGGGDEDDESYDDDEL